MPAFGKGNEATPVHIAPAAAVWPDAARAQQPHEMRRIGVLMGSDESDHEAQSFVAAFREESRKLGWTEGRNIQIDTRWAKADVELMKRSAKELVMLQPDFILYEQHTRYCGDAATHSYHPDHFSVGCRSCR